MHVFRLGGALERSVAHISYNEDLPGAGALTDVPFLVLQSPKCVRLYAANKRTV